MKIYVASSWRNEYQQQVVADLRADGHEVYDFRGQGDGWGGGGDGPGGFGWKEVDPEWQSWPSDIPRYLQGLDNPRAVEGFLRDMDALRASDACIMVAPCGPSASMEMGWAVGAGKPVAVYMPAIREPDLMVKMADFISMDFVEIRTWAKAEDAYAGKPRKSEQQRRVADWYRKNGGSASLKNAIDRAAVELTELLVAVEDFPDFNLNEVRMESADVTICLLAAAETAGFDLMEAVSQKQSINEQRKWIVSKDGTLTHDRTVKDTQ